MGQNVCPVISGDDRARLEAIVADRNRARRVGVGRPTVCRWQRRFAAAGVDGLLRDATRKPGKAPLGEAVVRGAFGT